jgi:hypothetical protein
MTITMRDDQSAVLTAKGLDAGGNPSDTSYSWTCSPADLLYFREGGNATATGRIVTLVTRGPIGSGSVTVTDAEGHTATATVVVTAGSVVTLDIEVGAIDPR